MCEHTLMCETGGYLPHTIKQYMYKYTIRCVHDYEIKKKKMYDRHFYFSDIPYSVPHELQNRFSSVVH